jgi:hypothetical protein
MCPKGPCEPRETQLRPWLAVGPVRTATPIREQQRNAVILPFPEQLEAESLVPLRVRGITELRQDREM